MIGPRPKAAELGFRDIELGQTFEIERTFTAEDARLRIRQRPGANRASKCPASCAARRSRLNFCSAG